MSALDPITFAILTGRLEQIADEMDATLYRSAFNPIIAEARDACHGLYHPESGATLVQGYTGFIYGGPGWPRRLQRELAAKVRAAGLATIEQAIGADARS